MELELRLSLSNSSPKFSCLKELDLISFVNYNDNSSLSCVQSGNDESKKRGYDEVESSVSSKTLPLFFWDKDPNEQDKDPKRHCNAAVLILHRNGDDLMGWPPLKSYQRNNIFYRNDPLRRRQMNFPAGGNGGCCGGRLSIFVKVQMEGFLITRKINLKLHPSYVSLMCCLLAMFSREHDSIADYQLTYLDTEDDWLLAGDLPWRAFVYSVKRLKLLKRGG